MIIPESSRFVKLSSKGISASHHRWRGRTPARKPPKTGVLPCFVTPRAICTINRSPQRLSHLSSSGCIFIPIRSLHVLTIRSPSLLAGVVPLLNAAELITNQRRASTLPFAHRGGYHLLLPMLFLPRSRALPRPAMLFA